MSEKVYFKNLHGFRFLAAAAVILSHIELFKKRVSISNLWDTPFFFEAGSAGVDFFFVLSGFLITTLLLKEIEKIGTIDVRKFYMRRILRIWPLYYLVILICYFIIPHLDAFYISGYSEALHVDFFRKLIFSIFFMPNAALSFFGEIPYAAPLWSVGVEEQFYLFWPLLMLLPVKRIRLIGIFILSFIAIKVVLVLSGRYIEINANTFEKIKNLVVATRMECMGIGALGACLIYNKSSLGTLASSNLALWTALVLLPFVIYRIDLFFELHHIVLSLIFLVIILNGATNSRTPISLEHRIFITMGNISYGLYLWHCLCIGLLLNILRSFGLHLSSSLAFNVLLYIGTFGLSILVSWVSYRYFESVFLARKRKYSLVLSGPEVKDEGIQNNSNPTTIY